MILLFIAASEGKGDHKASESNFLDHLHFSLRPMTQPIDRAASARSMSFTR